MSQVAGRRGQRLGPVQQHAARPGRVDRFRVLDHVRNPAETGPHRRAEEADGQSPDRAVHIGAEQLTVLGEREPALSVL
jgi:hypothetical protein